MPCGIRGRFQVILGAMKHQMVTLGEIKTPVFCSFLQLSLEAGFKLRTCLRFVMPEPEIALSEEVGGGGWWWIYLPKKFE